MPVDMSSSKMIRIGLNIKDSSPLGDLMTNYAIKLTPRRQTCVVMKICIMTSHVRYSE